MIFEVGLLAKISNTRDGECTVARPLRSGFIYQPQSPVLSKKLLARIHRRLVELEGQLFPTSPLPTEEINELLVMAR